MIDDSLGVKLYTDIIKEGQKCGEFSHAYESEIVARTIVSFIDGLAVDDSHLPKESLKIKEQYILFLDYLKMTLRLES